ncbi:protein yippee-like 2 isoform X1 [Tachysurus ichikawai]
MAASRKELVPKKGTVSSVIWNWFADAEQTTPRCKVCLKSVASKGVCPTPRTTTALTCVLRCFPCEPSWAGSPFVQRAPSPPMLTMTRSKTFQAYLPTCHRTYSCIHCRAHLANHDELISKSFQGSQGRAYLFNSVVNVGCGPAEERVLLTGLHAVADIYCENCKTTLGWKYEHAFESSQKYKEGKFIIELAHMIKDNGWD